MKRKLHARFWIGGEKRNLPADHTEKPKEREKTKKNTAQMRHSCAISGLKQPEKLIRQHLFPLSIFDGEGARGQCHLNKKRVLLLID